MMTSSRRGRSRIGAGLAVLASAAVATAVVAASGGASAASTAGKPSSAPARLITAKPAPSASPGTVTATAGIPWREVTTGWTLTLETGGPIGRGATTLYLVSPAGRTYPVHHWKHGTTWQLVGMSPGGTVALFQNIAWPSGKSRVYLMNIKSGATTGFAVPANSVVAGFGPAGSSVLVGTGSGVYRYSLTGVRRAYLTGAGNLREQDYSVPAGGPVALASPAGRDIVIANGQGLLDVTPGGRLVRYLKIAGPYGECVPARWQNSRVVIAFCQPAKGPGSTRLFAVPADGARPRALTPAHSWMYGLTDTWTLDGTKYVQAESSCGPPFLGVQHRNGTVTAVTIPGDASGSVVDATTGDQMTLTRASCEGFSILLRFDPVTGHTRMIFNGTTGAGAYNVVADNRDGTQP
jgi:hypothetical protein